MKWSRKILWILVWLLIFPEGALAQLESGEHLHTWTMDSEVEARHEACRQELGEEATRVAIEGVEGLTLLWERAAQVDLNPWFEENLSDYLYGNPILQEKAWKPLTDVVAMFHATERMDKGWYVEVRVTAGNVTGTAGRGFLCNIILKEGTEGWKITDVYSFEPAGGYFTDTRGEGIDIRRSPFDSKQKEIGEGIERGQDFQKEWREKKLIEEKKIIVLLQTFLKSTSSEINQMGLELMKMQLDFAMIK